MNYVDEIKHFGEEVEVELSVIWDILAKFKTISTGGNTALIPDELVNFQFRLTQILHKVTQKYYRLTYVRKGLEKQKKKIGYKEFVEQRKNIQNLLDFLSHLLVIGKSLGDAFVFIFYSLDREYLNQHLQSVPQALTLPRGIGGVGEMEFIKNVKMIQGQLLIYHGITNILRIGDVTLFDIQKNRVSAVGELKSGILDESTLTINLTIIGHKSREVPYDITIDKAINSDKEFNFIDIERYEKQVKTMADSFKYLDNSTINNVPKNFFSLPKFEVIKELVNYPKDKAFAYKQTDKSLILGRHALKGSTLFERFMGFDDKLDLDVPELTNLLTSILTPGFENSIVFGQIHFSRKMRIQPIVGSKPFFWNSVDISVLKKIYFSEVLIFSLYNIGHLLNAMKDLGYTWEYNEQHKMNGFSKKTPEMNYFISQVPFFVSMITDYLQDESVVVDTINSTATSLLEEALKGGKTRKAIMNIILR